MRRNRVHFGNESKARDFASERGGQFHENKGNTNKPFTVSFSGSNAQSRYSDPYDGSDFDSDINGNGTDWHISEDL